MQEEEIIFNPNLTGKVWDDSDADGIQDFDEDGVQDIKIDVVDSETDILITSGMTNEVGEYAFELDSNVNFYVKIALGGNPQKYAPSPSNVLNSSIGSTIDSDLTGNNGYWATDAYSSHVVNRIDLGIYKTGSISGFVWSENWNTFVPNVYGASDDKLLEDKLVRIYKIDLATGEESFYNSTTTDSLGHYRFDYVIAGSFIIEFELEVILELESFVVPHVGENESLDSEVTEYDVQNQSIIGRTPYLYVGASDHEEWINAGIRSR